MCFSCILNSYCSFFCAEFTTGMILWASVPCGVRANCILELHYSLVMDRWGVGGGEVGALVMDGWGVGGGGGVGAGSCMWSILFFLIN